MPEKFSVILDFYKWEILISFKCMPVKVFMSFFKIILISVLKNNNCKVKTYFYFILINISNKSLSNF